MTLASKPWNFLCWMEAKDYSYTNNEISFIDADF
jgi:hypothetical protein